MLEGANKALARAGSSTHLQNLPLLLHGQQDGGHHGALQHRYEAVKVFKYTL